MRRATGGWQVIGSVELDDPALVEKLGYLRKTASELAGGQLASKLVIPNSEILYRVMDAPGLSDEDREKAIRLGLEGATPYAVDDLVYDWVDAGDGKALVCAVARDTLDEAESFASEHRFNPVSFVAIPDGDTFVGEPFFGETSQCASILPADESVESDPGPIVVVGDHDPETAPIPQATPIPQETPDEKHSNDNGADETLQLQTKLENNDPETSEGEPDSVAATENSADIKAEYPDSQTNEPSPFSSSRKGLVGDEDALSGLENISARFALYPDRSRPDEISGDDESPTPAPTVIPKAVNAPDVVGSDDIIAETPVEKPAKPKPKKTPKADVNSPAQKPEPILLSDQNPGSKTIAPLNLGKINKAPKRSKTIGVSLGLSLTALVLLVVLVSSIFFNRPFSASRLFGGFNGAETTLTAQSLSEPQIVATTIAPQGQTEENLELAAINPADHPNELQAATEVELAEAELDLSALGEINEEEALVIQSTTGVWVLAPIPPVSLEAEKMDEFYIASIDRRVNSNDAVALPGTAFSLNDIRLGKIASPAPAGTLYDLDELGRVKPTVNGAMSADGVLIFSGKPPYTPALRPTNAAGFEPAVLLARSISDRRPILRPENLAEANERAQLGGLSRAELANKRPIARPTSPQDIHEEVDETPTQLAILSSRYPVNRPANFAQAVTAARNAAQANAVNAAVASAASTAVAAPRVPSIPTSASVAREATVENAINLTRVNLIGVYGSSSDRRALVRLKNGRYVKVQIGDRLDGGKVAAINGNRLQYVKRGRMLTLDIAS